MTWLYKDQEERDFFASLSGLPARTAGLLAVTILDDRLMHAIKARWYDAKYDRGKLSKRLFKFDGPVGTFGTRVHIGFAMGIYGEDSFVDLHTMRRIRNHFAHKLAGKDFDVPKLATLAMSLKISELVPIVKKGTVTTGVNPSTLEIAKMQLAHSSVADITTPRNRFIRATEILSSLLFWAAFDQESKRPKPEF